MIAFGPDKRDARMLIPPSEGSRLRSEIEKRDLEARRLSATGAADLLKHVAIEWIRDKCPQLGAALAFYTVFSLAPLMVVLVGIFGLIYGGSVQAQEKILEELRYFLDPSGMKVVKDIATSAAHPTASVLSLRIARHQAWAALAKRPGSIRRHSIEAEDNIVSSFIPFLRQVFDLLLAGNTWCDFLGDRSVFPRNKQDSRTM